MKKKTIKRNVFYCLGLILATILMGASFLQPLPQTASKAVAAENIYLYNPYRFVDFSEAQNMRSSLHNHTTFSDGADTPQQLTNYYNALGYDFVAVSDHDKQVRFEDSGITDMRGMVYVRGQEMSNSSVMENKVRREIHHTVSLFNNAGWATLNERPVDTKSQIEDVLRQSEGEGRFFLAHPQRYSYNVAEMNARPNSPLENFQTVLDGTVKPRPSVAWYKDVLKITEVLGMEVHNQADNRPEFWDRILLETMPNRPVWGFSSDDNHGAHYGFNAVMPSLTTDKRNEDGLKEALEVGSFFTTSFRVDPSNLDNRTGASRWDFSPVVTNVIADTKKGEITIKGRNFTNIIWYTGGTEYEPTKKIAEGEKFNYLENINDINKYVRAVLVYEENGTVLCETLVQPFGFGPYNPNSGYFKYKGPSDSGNENGGGETGGETGEDIILNAQTPNITAQPKNAQITLNDQISLAVKASVNDGGSLTYQWFSHTEEKNSGGTLIRNATSAVYAPTFSEKGTFYYYVVIRNTNPNAQNEVIATTISNVAKISIDAADQGNVAKGSGCSSVTFINNTNGPSGLLMILIGLVFGIVFTSIKYKTRGRGYEKI